MQHQLVMLTLGFATTVVGCTRPPAPVIAAPPPPPAVVEHRLSVTGAGRALERVTSDPVTEASPALSPDGSVLLFSIEGADAAGTVVERTIGGVDPTTGARRTLYTSTSSSAMQPAWLPDGSSFVYSSDTTGAWSLVRALSGTPNAAVTVIVSGQTAPEPTQPAVAPGGAHVAFTTLIRGTQTIAFAGTDGSRFTLLGEGVWPRWSPDGTRLTFARAANGHWNLFTIDAASGTDLVQLTSSGDEYVTPSYSPDGRYIVFATSLGTKAGEVANWNLYLLKPDGTGLTQLTEGDSNNSQPFWGNDGFIYFTSDQAGNLDIWRLQPVGEFASSAPSATASKK